MKLRELKSVIRDIEDLQRKIKSMEDIAASDFGDLQKVTFMLFDVWVEMPLPQAQTVFHINLGQQRIRLAEMMKEINVEKDDDNSSE